MEHTENQNENKPLSLILKAVTVLSAAVGIGMTAADAKNSFMGGRTMYMFFTIQSNILIAIICLIGFFLMIRGREVGKAWRVIKLTGTVAITLTGLVFCFVLVPVLGNRFWNVYNTLTHVVVPIAAVADWFASGAGRDLKKRCAFFVLIPPFLYVVYAAIGFVRGWQFSKGVNYPYFFLNWGSPAGVFGFTEGPPFMGCGWWILSLMLLLLFTGWLYITLAQCGGGKAKREEPEPSGDIADRHQV